MEEDAATGLSERECRSYCNGSNVYKETGNLNITRIAAGIMEKDLWKKGTGNRKMDTDGD